MDISDLLAFSTKNNASDLHLSAGLPPMIRVDGDIRRINMPELEHKEVRAMIYDIMNDKQRRDLEEFLEVDFSFELPGTARFRVNAFNQDRGAAAVFRTIPVDILTLEDLGCPQSFKEIINVPRGIVLVTGPTGSGKSTTLAALIDYKNDHVYEHILTIEDPIEFVHKSKNRLINQREVHKHTHGFSEALRVALREDPDIILVGEMRDLETIRLALTAAETGHLVFGTLHTSSAAKTIDRIIDVFPEGEKGMVRSMLSESLRAVIAQTLMKKIGGGRIAAWEIMTDTPAIRNLIREDKIAQMYSTIQTSRKDGMQTLDQHMTEQVQAASKGRLSNTQTLEIVLGIMTAEQKEEFQATNECQFAIQRHDIGRFRASAFTQRGSAGMVLRRIESKIPTTEELGIPPILDELAMTKRGLIIFVGATGTGKSTSLAAMVGYRNNNSNSSGHIITIEDPIEYLHNHAGCVVSQREVGIDTKSYEVALKNTLRQAPDVILIGEIRTRETMNHSIAFAETGHLCLSTLHANNANQALDRIIHFFPEDAHKQLFMDLSLNLKALIAQQLVPTMDGKGRKAVVEILINTPLASDYIRKGDVHKLKDLMKKSPEHGVQTFDQALYELYKEGEISYENALIYADSKNEVRLMIELGEGSTSSLSDDDDMLLIDNG